MNQGLKVFVNNRWATVLEYDAVYCIIRYDGADPVSRVAVKRNKVKVKVT